jgi:Flp pilus assembly protein TadD
MRKMEVAMPAMLVGIAFLGGCLLALPVAGQDWKAWNEPPQRATQTVSADLLRHPISYKTRGMLQRALNSMRSGKHLEAIQRLQDTLAKDPASAPYVHSLLGFELMQTDQFAAAVKSFEQAVVLLAHDAINRTNFGISLAATGDLEGAKAQARRAHELDPDNPEIQRFLDALLTRKLSGKPVMIANTP